VYNIMAVFNSSYFPFGKVWINSLYDKNDMSNVPKVFIVDTGLKEEEREYFLSKGDEVYIYDTKLKTDYNDGGAWGRGWQENVGSKTIVFKHLLEVTKLPLVMVDGDCIFVKDLEPLIDSNYDIQLCKRDAGTPYLGSTVIGQPRNATLDFMTLWIDRIETKPTNVPRESPSLSEIVEEKNHFANVGDIDRILVSTHWESEFSDNTHIIHLKTDIADRKIETRIRKSLESPDFKDLILEYLDV
jgi:hypothetical protein